MKPSNDREAITLILQGLVDKGVQIEYVFDGEERFYISDVETAVKHVCDVDEASVVLVLPESEDNATGGRSTFVWFVLGNEPYEVAADYGVSLIKYIDPIVDPWD